MATINSINNKSGSLTVDPGASGDSFVQLNINTVGKYIIGVDDSDGDKFKIEAGSAFTTAPFEVDANGIIRMTNQPAFFATNTAGDLNVTGDSTEFTCDFNSEIFDQGSDFSADTFAAPATGRYLLCTSVFFQGITSSHTAGNIKIVTSNRTYEFKTGNPYAQTSSGTNFQVNISVIADMDVSDTATVTGTIDNGAKVVDLFGAATDQYTGFSGVLVC